MKLDYSITKNWFVTFKSRFVAEQKFQHNKNEVKKGGDKREGSEVSGRGRWRSWRDIEEG